MIERGGGRIVITGSGASYLPGSTSGAYSASKAAVGRYGETLAKQVEPHGVKVFVISPGLVNTEMTGDQFPEDAPWTPPELAPRLVLELASGRFDALAGRYLHAEHDPPDVLESRIDAILRRGSERDQAATRALMLYQPEGYEPLTGEWDEERARAGIRGIVADAERRSAAESLWPADEWDSWRTPTPLKTLYVGAAGVIWGLDATRASAATRSRGPISPRGSGGHGRGVAARADFMAEVELPSRKESGLLSGETGILLVAWLLTGRAELADDLYERVRENEDERSRRRDVGHAGTLVAARADARGDRRRALARGVAGRRRGALVAARRARATGRSACTARSTRA